MIGEFLTTKKYFLVWKLNFFAIFLMNFDAFFNGIWFYSILAEWSTWKWVFLNFSQHFWSFNTPDTPGCMSAVIWNIFEPFLLQCSVCKRTDFLDVLSQYLSMCGKAPSALTALLRSSTTEFFASQSTLNQHWINIDLIFEKEKQTCSVLLNSSRRSTYLSHVRTFKQ